MHEDLDPPEELPGPLRERYQVLRRLGAGGMGTVLLARDRKLGREVAVKLLQGPDTPALRRRFRREARALAGLEHPHVLRVFDFGEGPEGAFLITEHVPGQSLDRLPPGPDLPARMLEVAAALDALHAAGLVHRDVKPANVLVAEGRAVLIDLGLVADTRATMLTATGVLVGTPAYLAPEVFAGEDAGPPADWYGWGATWFALREGRPPYSIELLVAVGEGAALPEPSFEATPPGPERELLRRALAQEPGERPSDSSESRALLAAQAPERRDRSTRRASPPARTRVRPRPARRRALGALGLLVAGALASAWWWRGESRRDLDAPPAGPPAGPSPLRQAAEAVARELAALSEIDSDPKAWPELEARLPSLPRFERRVLEADWEDPGHPDREVVEALLTRFRRNGLWAPGARAVPPPPQRELVPKALRGYAEEHDELVPAPLPAGSWLGALELAGRSLGEARARLAEVLENPQAAGALLGLTSREMLPLEITGGMNSPEELVDLAGRTSRSRRRWAAGQAEGLEAMARMVYVLGRLTARPGFEAELAAHIGRKAIGRDDVFLLSPLFLRGEVPRELAEPATPAAWLVRARLEECMGDRMGAFDLRYRSDLVAAYARAIPPGEVVPDSGNLGRLVRRRRSRALREIFQLEIEAAGPEDVPRLVERFLDRGRDFTRLERGDVAVKLARRAASLERLDVLGSPSGQRVLSLVEEYYQAASSPEVRAEGEAQMRRLRAAIAAQP